MKDVFSDIEQRRSWHARRRRRRERELSDERTRRLEEEVERLKVEVEQLSVYRNMAYLDHLTGLRNRRYFEERLAQELSRSKRANEPCSVVVLDVNDFKRINDEHGHATGDLVLRCVGDLLLNSQRTMDIACRIGGDEFAVILPATDTEGAASLSGRLRQAERELLDPHNLVPGLSVTLSHGTATYPDEAGGPDELIARADRAMYTEKRKRKESSPRGKVENAA